MLIHSPKHQTIDSLILAGGQSRRMGHPKALLEVSGKPLITHLTEQMAPLSQTLYIAARDKATSIQPWVASHQAEFIDDYYATDEGPLSAIAAGLKKTHNAWLWVASTDCFGDMNAVLSLLFTATTPPSSPIIFLNHIGRFQPLQALIHTDLTDDVIAWLDSGNRAVMPWYKKHNALAVEFTSPSFYSNLNSPEDYSGLLSHLAG